MTPLVALILSSALAAPYPTLAPSPELDEARRLHTKAQARFDTADYEGAIEAWTAALEALPNDPSSARLRPLIQYNVATALERSYALDGDVANLRKAKAVLESFARAVPTVYPDEAEATGELERVRARIETIDEKIATHDEESTPEPAPESGPEPEPTPEPEPAPEPEPDPVLDRPSELDSTPDRGRPLVISGAVLTGVGGAFAGLAIAGVVIGTNANDVSGDVADDFDARGRQFERGRTGNVLAVVGAVAAPVFVAAGVALLVVGKRRSKPGGVAKLLPSAGPTSAGLLLAGHF